MKRICLFLNGTFELSSFKIKIENKIITPLHLLKNNPKQKMEYYAADGGLNHLLKYNFPTSNLTWVGDGDSLNKKSKDFLKKIGHKKIHTHTCIHLNTEKDLSDLGAVLDAILSHNLKESIFIEIYGGLKKRRDHEIANIEEINRFLSMLPQGGTAFFHGGVVITSLPIKFLETNCQFFSVFASNRLVDIKGAEYSGRFLLQRPSHGLSNKITKKVLSIAPMDGLISIYIEE